MSPWPADLTYLRPPNHLFNSSHLWELPKTRLCRFKIAVSPKNGHKLPIIITIAGRFLASFPSTTTTSGHRNTVVALPYAIPVDLGDCRRPPQPKMLPSSLSTQVLHQAPMRVRRGRLVNQVRLPWSCHDRVLLSHDPGRCLWSVCDHIRPASAKPTKRSARVDSEYFLTQTTQASPFDSIQFGDDLTAFLCCNLYKNLYPTIFWRSVHSGEVHFYCGALEWLVFSIRRCTTLGVGKLKAAKNPLVIINYKNNGLWLTVECHENSH